MNDHGSHSTPELGFATGWLLWMTATTAVAPEATPVSRCIGLKFLLGKINHL
jgi:hypothetical protein